MKQINLLELLLDLGIDRGRLLPVGWLSRSTCLCAAAALLPFQGVSHGRRRLSRRSTGPWTVGACARETEVPLAPPTAARPPPWERGRRWPQCSSSSSSQQKRAAATAAGRVPYEQLHCWPGYVERRVGDAKGRDGVMVMGNRYRWFSRLRAAPSAIAHLVFFRGWRPQLNCL